MEEERWKYGDGIIPDGLWDWNLITNQVFYSKQWKEMLGFADSEIGESSEEWITHIHPEERQKTILLLENHLSGATDSFTSEHRMCCKDGSYKWVLSEGRIVSYDIAGKPVRMAGIQKDITKLKNTEFILVERVKELNCHNRISEIMNNSNHAVDEVLDMIVLIIPDSWHFPVLPRQRLQCTTKYLKQPVFNQVKSLYFKR